MKFFNYSAIIALIILLSSNVEAQIIDPNMDPWQSYISLTTTQSINSKGIMPYTYNFHDSYYRDLNVKFTKRETLSVSNNSIKNNKLLTFIDIYKVHFENDRLIIIDSLINTSRHERAITDVVLPFDNDAEYKYCNSVFPILPSGTVIRISWTCQDISINNFFFHVKAFTEQDKKEFDAWFWKELNK